MDSALAECFNGQYSFFAFHNGVWFLAGLISGAICGAGGLSIGWMIMKIWED